ncbi:MAG: hypothetical protein IJO56_06395 [Oscillospiraceae bacterium]|nr:hypothetical protein [Oscillospiraceae bacterium]
MKRLFLIFVCLLLLTSSVFLVASASGTLYISKQPMDIFAEPGDSVRFEISAVGEGLSYRWQFRLPGSDTWSNGAATTPYLVTNASDERDGISYRCIVTDSFGNSVTSRVCHLYIGTNALTLYGSQGLSFVLEWVSSVVNALVSPDGALFPLIGVLAIGIAVAALLLGIKAIRSFGWGL